VVKIADFISCPLTAEGLNPTRNFRIFSCDEAIQLANWRLAVSLVHEIIYEGITVVFFPPINKAGESPCDGCSVCFT
jgi:hypothetical protein